MLRSNKRLEHCCSDSLPREPVNICDSMSEKMHVSQTGIVGVTTTSIQYHSD